MLNELKYFFVLAVCCVSSAHPFSSNRQCSQFYIAQIKENYVKEILVVAENLDKISAKIEVVIQVVDKKLKQLEETLQLAIEFAGDKGFDINKCLNLDYKNQIRNAVEKHAYRAELNEGSEKLRAYVQDAVRKVEVCTLSHGSCKQIKKCAENVEYNFVEHVIEDGIEELQRYSFERIIIGQLTTEISIIIKSINKCYSNHLQKKTTTTTESAENVESETDTTGTDIPETTESEENVTESETDTTGTDIFETTSSDTIESGGVQ